MNVFFGRNLFLRTPCFEKYVCIWSDVTHTRKNTRMQGDQGPMLWFFKYLFSTKNLAFLAQTTASLCKNCDLNIGFWEKRQFFRQKLSKIAEKCDHNIGPRLGDCLLWAAFLNYTGSPQFWSAVSMYKPSPPSHLKDPDVLSLDQLMYVLHSFDEN
jgi:hypothetical protein